jgi:hypothetical protein
MLKKAAMFGLDARIALAIFGALSVISGAALYSAIQDSKTVKLLSNITEIEKAITAYILDTGSDLPYSSMYGTAGWDSVLAGAELMESTATGWKGPYLSYEIITGNYHLNYPDYGIFAVVRHAKDGVLAACTAASCQYVISMQLPEESIKKSLDLKVDSVDDKDNGKVKYTATHLYYYLDIPYK